MKKNDGWRIPDELWEQLEPLLPTAAASSAGMPQPTRAGPLGHERDFAGAAHAHAVERLERNSRVLVEFGLPALLASGATQG